jgi:hypothetical protein
MSAPVAYRFICVDDDVKNAPTLCNSIAATQPERLAIERRNPKHWESEIADILNAITAGTAHGVLLDYRLDENATVFSIDATPSKTKQLVPVSYTADSLIQELRRRSVENREQSFPVVLWSNAERLEEFHALDPDYRQHYDHVLDKEKLGEPAQIALILIALVNGYAAIRAKGAKSAAVSPFLQPPEGALAVSVDAYFKQIYPKGGFPYQSALFIIHQLLRADGPLIGLPMLQALLAVDVALLDTKKAREFLNMFRYAGVFSEGYLRWWKVPLLAHLDSLAESPGGWLKLNATQRAAALSKHLKLRGLVPFEPIQPDYSTTYETYCAHSKRPINRMNGYALFDNSPRVWKDIRFISAFELRRNYKVGAKDLRLEDAEERRFLAKYHAKPGK